MDCGTILHVNMVGLMAAVEERDDPALRGRPFVVADESAPRSCVLDLSPAAHREGIASGMPLALARKTLPGLLVRAPRHERYVAADAVLATIALAFTPLVERAGRGHVFADLAGTARLFGPPEDAAQKLRLRIMDDAGLRPAIALAGTKTASKVATRVFRPGGFVALSPPDETALVRRQPVSLLPGVGPALAARFRLLDIDTIGELADLGAAESRAVGARVPFLVARARGTDRSPVDPQPPERRRMHGSVLFEPDSGDERILRARLDGAVSDLAFELRKTGAGARRVTVEAVYTDGLRIEATAFSTHMARRDDEFVLLAREALGRAGKRRVRIRRLGITLSSIGPAGPELDLFEPGETRMNRLQIALDRIRNRHGGDALVPCARRASAPLAAILREARP